MDEPLLTLLTIAANTLITYFLLNNQAKRHKKSMEEFKASLQFLNFEQQTKFAEMYPKRVEALENLYHKYGNFCHALSVWEIKSRNRQINLERFGLPNGKVDYETASAELQKTLTDLETYFHTKRLILPTVLVEEISDIILKAELTKTSIAAVLQPDEWPKHPEAIYVVSSKISSLVRNVENKVNRLDEIYKLVAGAEK
jgi:hypothetical protein